MIKFFRAIRRQLVAESRFSKYLLYAFGEIILVVIGILIAMQINNWNQNRIQQLELKDSLLSIANGIHSDLRELNLLAEARLNIAIKVDSISRTYVFSDLTSLNILEAGYVTNAFDNITSVIQFNPNVTAFESLKNSNYFGKIQGTDLSLLLSAYYTRANEVRNLENNYNQNIKKLQEDWASNFRNNGDNLFYYPWSQGDFSSVGTRYLKILRDPLTWNILENGFGEKNAIQFYREQILIGEQLVDMIHNAEMTLDQQAKLNMSGVLFSFGDADFVSLLINGEIPIGFAMLYASSGQSVELLTKEKDYMVINYPANLYTWASPYFSVNALYGRVNKMDFTRYSKVVIEMRGEKGGEAFEIAMKDINDPSDGSESRVKIQLTTDWQTFEIETSKFATADMKSIMVPLAFIFQGAEGKKIHVRSIQFEK